MSLKLLSKFLDFPIPFFWCVCKNLHFDKASVSRYSATFKKQEVTLVSVRGDLVCCSSPLATLCWSWVVWVWPGPAAR